MKDSSLASELGPIDEERPISLVTMGPPLFAQRLIAADLASREKLDNGISARGQSEATSQQIGSDPGSSPMTKTCEFPTAATPNKKGPRDITNVRQSLTNIRLSLSQSPELQANHILQKSVSLESLGSSSRQLFPSKGLAQEVARLARRVECMERAFLMSPTEAVEGQQQDTNASPDDQKLCAQFVEVLERGREARKREVAELEHRMTQIDSLCRSIDIQEQIYAQDQDLSARLARSAEAFAQALECERVARQTDILELHDAVARKPLVSSTGGTALCNPGIDAMSTEECPQCSQVDTAANAAVVSSKAALSQHVAELHRQLSEDLMTKLREKVKDATEDWEKRIQAVNDLFPNCPEVPHLEKCTRDGIGKHMRGKIREKSVPLRECSAPVVSSALLGQEDQSCAQNRDLSSMSVLSIPAESEVRRRSRQVDSEHASAADIVDEAILATAVRPHASSVQGASKEAVAKRPSVHKSVMLGSPLLASQGSARG